MNPKFFALFLCLLAHARLQAQDRVVTGRVTSQEDNSPLPGANVVVKGKTTGTITDEEGNYRLSIPPDATALVFTFVGATTKEVAIDTNSVINVALSSTDRRLKEVVVVGYGTQKRTEITSAITSVSGAEIENQPVTSVDQALAGRAAGVQVSLNSGTPGAGVNIRIRGSGSITSSNEPLYVIDGVPVTSSSALTRFDNAVGSNPVNPLSTINPNDIESIEILKDAAATSIYGARAANGVVLITTKRGQGDQTRVTLNAYYGFQEPWRKLDLLNSAQFVELQNEALTTAGSKTRLDPTKIAYDTDWQDNIFRRGIVENYDASLAGRSGKTSFYVSGAYSRQQGSIIESEFNRMNFRANIDHQVNDKLTIGNSLTVSRTRTQRINNYFGGVIGVALQTPPTVSVRNAIGEYGVDTLNGRDNPVAIAEAPDFYTLALRTLGNVYAQYEPIPGLVLYSRFNVDLQNTENNYYLPPGTTFQGRQFQGRGIANDSREWLWNSENTVTYSRTFAEQHAFTWLGGFSVQEASIRRINAEATNFPETGIPTLGAGAIKNDASTSVQGFGIVSYFSRLNYSFRDGYLLQANFRVDGSSRLAAGNQYDIFPSVSAGWRVSQEKFLANNPVITELKIRGSFGYTGNQEGIANYYSQGLVVSGFNYASQGGIAPQNAPNPNLKWERTRQYDAGIDLDLFDRISIIADYYYKETNDLLVAVLLPKTAGFNSYLQNNGQMTNEGFEIALNTQNFVGAFKWTTNFNFARNINTLARLATGDFPSGPSIDSGERTSLSAEGAPIGQFYGYVTNGIFQTTDEITQFNEQSPTGVYQSAGTSPGDIRFKDVNGDGVVNSNDRTVIGNGLPDFFGGITNNFSLKGFELSVLLQYVYGNELFNNNRLNSDAMRFTQNATTNALNRWRSPEQPGNGNVPRAIQFDPNRNSRVSDRWVEDGSFLRIRTVSLAYNIPMVLCRKVGLNSVRVYANAQNLYTFTNYTGFDPEVNLYGGDSFGNTALGVDLGNYPPSRTVTFGINVGL